MFKIKDIKKIIKASVITEPRNMYTFENGRVMLSFEYDRNNIAKYAYCKKDGEVQHFFGKDAHELNASCILRYLEIKTPELFKKPRSRRR